MFHSMNFWRTLQKSWGHWRLMRLFQHLFGMRWTRTLQCFSLFQSAQPKRRCGLLCLKPLCTLSVKHCQSYVVSVVVVITLVSATTRTSVLLSTSWMDTGRWSSYLLQWTALWRVALKWVYWMVAGTKILVVTTTVQVGKIPAQGFPTSVMLWLISCENISTHESWTSSFD